MQMVPPTLELAIAGVAAVATLTAAAIALVRLGRTWGEERQRSEDRDEEIEGNIDSIDRLERRVRRVERATGEIGEAVEEVHVDVQKSEAKLDALIDQKDGIGREDVEPDIEPDGLGLDDPSDWTKHDHDRYRDQT